MNTTGKITHISVALVTTFTCLGLWALLAGIANGYANSSLYLPRFTALIMGLRTWLLWLPIPAILYCGFALFRQERVERSGVAFLALTMVPMCFVFFTVLMALSIPFELYLSRH